MDNSTLRISHDAARRASRRSDYNSQSRLVVHGARTTTRIICTAVDT